MPSQNRDADIPARPIRVCLFGDSNLAAFKRAFDQGYDTGGNIDVSFFGAQGPAFRKIRIGDGVVRPDQKLIDSGKLISTNGHVEIRAGDFDAILFTGARLRSNIYFQDLVPGYLDPARFLTERVRYRITDTFVVNCRAARMAAVLKQRGLPFVGFSPASFLNASVKLSYELTGCSEMSQATRAIRADVWDQLRARLASDGIVLFEQPEETVTEGCFSHPDYAVEGAVEKGDAAHKNAAYAKLILDKFFGSREFQALRGGASLS